MRTKFSTLNKMRADFGCRYYCAAAWFVLHYRRAHEEPNRVQLRVFIGQHRSFSEGIINHLVDLGLRAFERINKVTDLGLVLLQS